MARPSPPRPIVGACVWTGAEMAASARWRRTLAPADLDALDDALARSRKSAPDWTAMTRADFPVAALDPLLDDIAEELENGSGMLRLSGLPVARYATEDLRRLWFGIGLRLGTPRFQNRQGELMRAIRDEGAQIGLRYGQLEGGAGAPFLSSYARTLSSGQLRFHTDRCDVVGLLCVRRARAGGVSTLCSSPAVHNAMLAERPELCAALYEDMWRSRFGEEAGGEDRPYPLPVFGVRDGRFTSHYSLTYIEAAQRLGNVPRLSDGQREALACLAATMERLSFAMTLEPGDMQFLNNHVVYHGRTAFEDDAASGRDRLLLRLWLAMANSRALPAGHEVLWGEIAAGALRGGIAQG